MIIPLLDGWRLRSDPHCWILEYRRVNKKTLAEEWRAKTYHTTIRDGVRELAEQSLRAAECATLQDAVAEVERLSVELSRLLEPYLTLDVSGGRK